MYRLQYRNFGAYDTLVVNHTVDVGTDRGGVRWYEVRNPHTRPRSGSRARTRRPTR